MTIDNALCHLDIHFLQFQHFLYIEKGSLKHEGQQEGGGVGEPEVTNVQPGHGGEAAVNSNLGSSIEKIKSVSVDI